MVGRKAEKIFTGTMWMTLQKGEDWMSKSGRTNRNGYCDWAKKHTDTSKEVLGKFNSIFGVKVKLANDV